MSKNKPNALHGARHLIILSVLLTIALCMSTCALADVHGYAQTGTDLFAHTYERGITGNPAQDIVTIALAQKGKTGSELGYTDDWCAAFVTDCAKYAGVSNLMPFVSGHTHACGGYTDPRYKGLYEYMLLAGATEVGSASKQAGTLVFSGEAKAGDIVFFRETGSDRFGHVGIATGSNSTIEGNLGAEGTTSYLNSIVWTQSIMNRGNDKDYDLIRVLRPNYPAGRKPAKPVITTDRDTYFVGGTVTIALSNTEGSSSQYMQVRDIATGEYLYDGYTIGTYSHQLKPTIPGTYTINYQIANNYGSSDVASKQFTVLEKLALPTITLDKSEYRTGDKVIITIGNTAYTDSQYMQIRNMQTNELLFDQSITGNSRIVITVTQPGTYQIACQAASQTVQSDVAYQTFTVVQTETKYTPKGPIAVPRIFQVSGDERGDCHLNSFASVQAYMMGSYSYNGYGSRTYSGYTDYEYASDPMWHKCYDVFGGNVPKYNDYSHQVPNLPYPMETYVRSLNAALVDLYHQLSLGNPVVVYETQQPHASVVIGYVGNSDTLRAEDFVVMEIARGSNLWHNNPSYASTPQIKYGWPSYPGGQYCYHTLDSWLRYDSSRNVYAPGNRVVNEIRLSYPKNDGLKTPFVGTNKDAYIAGETVTITLANTEGSTSQYMQFKYLESGNYLYDGYTTGTYTYQFTLTTPGTYQINYQISNNHESSQVVTKRITVIDKLPAPTITLNRNEYLPGDKVIVSIGSIEYSDSQYMQIRNMQTNELLFDRSITGVPQHEITVSQPGTYQIACQSASQNVQSDVTYKTFTVLESTAKPSRPSIVTSRDVYVAGESVTIVLGDISVSTMQYMQLQNHDTGEFIYDQDCTGIYQHSFVLNQAGRYGISYQTANNNGQSPSVYKGITVIAQMLEPTITTDKDSYIVGETISITLGNAEASDSQYMQVKNVDTGDFIFDGSTTGQFEYEIVIQEPGTYAILYQTACQLGQSPAARKEIQITGDHVHTETVDAAVPATHLTFGLTEGMHCSSCGVVLVPQETIPIVEVSGKMILPTSLEVIHEEAFTNNRFDCVVISGNCTTIASRAFMNCSQLRFVEIPSSVLSIDSSAFEGCSDSLIIVTTSGSYAESFAEEQGFTCVLR